MDLLSYCASGKYSKKRSLKSAIALRNKEAGEHNIDRKPLELPQFYKALCHHHPSSKHQPHLLYFDKGDIIKVLEKGDSMWRGCKKDPPPTEPPSDAPCAKQNATTRREDGSLKTPEPMLATSNSVSGWFPSDNLCLTKDLKVTHDKQLSNDDTVSIIDVPPAMTEFKHSRYDTSEVIKRPQNDLCKDSDRDSGISPQHLQQFYSQQCQSQSPSTERTAEWLGRYVTSNNCESNAYDYRRNSSGSSNGSIGMNSLGTPSSRRINVPPQCHLHNLPPSSPSLRYQHRLSGQSTESGVSLTRTSYGSNSSLTGGNITSSSNASLLVVEEKPIIDVAALSRAGIDDNEIIKTWLDSLNLNNDYYEKFIKSSYDMATISRMTPEDLNAIGISNPSHRKILKCEIGKLKIYDGIPDFKPTDVSHWLSLLHLECYLETLQSQGYRNLEDVVEITWEDMEEIGIKALGHQKKLSLAVAKLIRINDGHKRLSSGITKKNSEIDPPNSPLRMPTTKSHSAISSPKAPSTPTTPSRLSSRGQLNVSSFRPAKRSTNQEAQAYCTLPRKRITHKIIEERPPSADERLLAAAADAISTSFISTPSQRNRKKPPPPPKRTASIKKPDHRDVIKLCEQASSSNPINKSSDQSPSSSSPVISANDEETLSNVVERLNFANQEDSLHCKETQNRRSSTTSIDSSFDNNTLHFANENVGTIKQKNAAPKLSIIPSSSDISEANATHSNSSSSQPIKTPKQETEIVAPVLPKRQDSIGVTNRINPEWSPLGNRRQKLNGQNNTPILPERSSPRVNQNISAKEILIPKQKTIAPCVTDLSDSLANQTTPIDLNNSKSTSVENACDVLGDIDSMLQNLTNELDALLVGDV